MAQARGDSDDSDRDMQGISSYEDEDDQDDDDKPLGAAPGPKGRRSAGSVDKTGAAFTLRNDQTDAKLNKARERYWELPYPSFSGKICGKIMVSEETVFPEN